MSHLCCGCWSNPHFLSIFLKGIGQQCTQHIHTLLLLVEQNLEQGLPLTLNQGDLFFFKKKIEVFKANLLLWLVTELKLRMMSSIFNSSSSSSSSKPGTPSTPSHSPLKPPAAVNSSMSPLITDFLKKQKQKQKKQTKKQKNKRIEKHGLTYVLFFPFT